MPVGTGLPVNRLIDVTWSLSAQPGIVPSINTSLILGPSPVIDPVERIRDYLTLDEVATDFSAITPEYQAAVDWFSQSPQPQQLWIGRWVQIASAAVLIGGALSAQQQLITNWIAITNGGVNFTINGVAHNLSGLNFSGVTNLNGVAAIITTALGGAGAMVWDANYEYFELTTATTGSMATIGFAQPGVGTDISGMLAMTATSSGAYVAQGMAPETAIAAIAVFDTNFAGSWYGLVAPTATDTDHEAIAAYIEGANPPHYYGVTTSEPGAISPVSTTDIAYILSSFGYNKTACQYSSSSAAAIASYLARILTTQWNGQNTTITVMWKQEPGVVPEVLNNTQANALQAKNCNVLADYANGTQLIQYGTSCSGQFTDTIIGADALSVQVQANYFNALYTTTTKIPQTDAGMQILLAQATAACVQFNINGYLATGTWNTTGFGTLNYGDVVPNGYYCYAPPMALQPEASRQLRQAPLTTIGAKLAGAIHSADVMIVIQP